MEEQKPQTILKAQNQLPRIAFHLPLHGESDQEMDEQTGTGVLTRPTTKQPKQYKVLLLNDDYTPMDFVVYVIKKYFKKSTTEATQIMLDVHQKGSGVAGTYSFEIAEMKSFQVNQDAKRNKHPLKSVIEEA
jgi:ATP-dependent Clp protease adaptor protein ClpS